MDLESEVFDKAYLTLSKVKARRRAADNQRLPDGLLANDRLMIQQLPGSGESSYAMSLANNRHQAGDERILFLLNTQIILEE